MFTVYEVTGQANVYVPGSIRDRRRVHKIPPSAPVSAIVKKVSDSLTPQSGHSKPWSPTHSYELIHQAPERVKAIVANQIMTKPVVTIEPTAMIQDAWKLFQSRRFRHVPVLSLNRIIVGLLSDRDVLRVVAGFNQGSGEKGANPGILSIQNVMTTRILTAHPETEIRSIALVMFEERIGAMPIVDQDDSLVGMITRSDILRTVMQQVPFELWI